MRFRISRRALASVVVPAAVALGVVLGGAAGPASAAKPAPTSANGCPNGGTYLVDPDIGASYQSTGNTTTYTFSSWVDKSPNTNNVPGLIGYCVTTSQTPTAVTVIYDSWKASKPGQTFSFTRPNGDKTNIPLDGTTDISIGSATFDSTPPGTQTILLHVSDAATCQTLYGGTATTCYVLPGPKPGPVCDAGAGSTDFAYNAMPFDIYNGCPPRASFSFEGNLPTKELGDEVTLAGTGTTITSMTVSFSSWGCGTSGHWNTGDCVTTNFPTNTFTIPDTLGQTGSGGLHANIYSVAAGDTLGTLLGSAVNTDPIPYRPSADGTNCTNPGKDADGGNDTGKWYDAAANLCLNGYSFPVTFKFSGVTVPAGGNVIWTVWYDTSNSGSYPLGNLTSCRTTGNPGCGYDSLNVDTWTYANAPYAGTDTFPDLVWWDKGTGSGLATSSGWTNYKPLAQITTG